LRHLFKRRGVQSWPVLDRVSARAEVARFQVRTSTSLILLMAMVGCRYPNEFKNVNQTVPHGVLRGTKYPNAGHIFATHINGQPTSFWRSTDVFRIPAGSNSCEIAFSSRKETIGYAAMSFVTGLGREYEIVRERKTQDESPVSARPHPATPNAWIVADRRERALIRQLNASGADNIVAETWREDYVFGADSEIAAIAKYREKTR
jgi:hypothetical protein